MCVVEYMSGIEFMNLSNDIAKKIVNNNSSFIIECSCDDSSTIKLVGDYFNSRLVGD